MIKNKLMSMLLAGSITIALISLVVTLPHIFTNAQISYGIMAILAGTIFYFLYQIVKPMFEVEVSEEVVVVKEEVVEEVPTMKAEPKPKRKRRTKAEIQQAAEVAAPKKRGPKTKK
jgi:hypothetical protein